MVLATLYWRSEVLKKRMTFANKQKILEKAFSMNFKAVLCKIYRGSEMAFSSRFLELFLAIFLFSQLQTFFPLKVFKTVLHNEFNFLQTGLHYIKDYENPELSGSLTICSRFNFKKFSWFARLWDIKTPNNLATFLWLSPNYPLTFFIFGDNFHYVVKDPKTEEFNVWYVQRWHHICFAFDQRSTQFTF